MKENIKNIVQKKERSILDTAYGLSNQIEDLKEIDPVAAGEVFKSVLQYLKEKNTTKQYFTIGELVELGYLPETH